MTFDINLFSVINGEHKAQCLESSPGYLESRNGYIANSIVASEPELSSKKCRWIISGMPGQVINITAINFNPIQLPQNCPHLGSVKDLYSGSETTICKSEIRQQHVYMSSGKEVQITLAGSLGDDDTRVQLLIYYEGIYSLLAH